MLDIKLIILTVIAIISRKRALNGVVKILVALNADETLIRVASRKGPLVPSPPPSIPRRDREGQ